MDINAMNNVLETISSIIESCNKNGRTIEYMTDNFNKLCECIIKDFSENSYEQIPDKEWNEIYKTDSDVMIYVSDIQIVIRKITFGVFPHMGTKRGFSLERFVYYLSCNDGVVLDWHYSLDDDIMGERTNRDVRITSSGEYIENFSISS